jgi:hypothetical protein
MKTRLLVAVTAFAAAGLYTTLDAELAEAGGEIKGKISFDGTPPTRRTARSKTYSFT